MGRAIGAGPTGLGAAYRLHELGYDNWVLYEKSDGVGGHATSHMDEHGFVWGELSGRDRQDWERLTGCTSWVMTTGSFTRNPMELEDTPHPIWMNMDLYGTRAGMSSFRTIPTSTNLSTRFSGTKFTNGSVRAGSSRMDRGSPIRSR